MQDYVFKIKDLSNLINLNLNMNALNNKDREDLKILY